MPYHLTHKDGGYFVVSPHGHYLSKHPLTKEQAMKQETAVRLTEIRKNAEGVPFVPVSRDMVHKHQVLPTRDIFAPLPLPTHYLRKQQNYATTGM